MTAFLKNNRTIHIGYSTNVHRAESLEEVSAFLDRTTIRVKNRILPPGRRMGLDLRLGSALVRELDRDSSAVEALADGLETRGLYVFGINGFPLGDFQARTVKRSAYRPDWKEVGRLEDTLTMGRVLARLLPEGAEGAVSTVAGGYRAFGDDPSARDAMAASMVRAARAFAELREDTGRTVTLAPEPEPDTTMDDCPSVLDFYRRHLWPAADRLEPRGAEIVRRHLPVNLDACHLSVAFENPAEIISRLEAAGIRVGKSNISCCPSVAAPAVNEAGRRFLADLAEPRFLHQTRGRDADGAVRLRLPDLDDFRTLTAADLEGITEVRSHFHVPLSSGGGEGFTTTRDETAAFLAALLAHTDCRGLAVETYTWPVLDVTPLGRQVEEDLAEGLAAELRWTMDRIRELGWTEASSPG